MAGTALTLAACDDAGNFTLFEPAGQTAAPQGGQQSIKLVERDVEQPDVFQATTAGLWDGRPSLGGVWVAHADATDPERVIIRNEVNGKFVIGALFRREREAPGPALQISSDAANALGMLAGQPAQLNVTALRRESVPEAPAPDPAAALPPPDAVQATALDPLAGAAAAIEAGVDPDVTPPAVAAPARPAIGLEKPFVQIGIFSVEDNAKGTAQRLRNAGIVPTVLAQESQGKKFWRVIVGPASTSADRAAVLKTVKAQGFSDAYFVTN